MVVPITLSMERQDLAPRVIGVGTSVYGVLAAIFGAVGCAFGFGSCDLVTKCLPAGLVARIVRWALAVKLVINYPVLLFPVTNTLESWIFPPTASRRPLLVEPAATTDQGVGVPHKAVLASDPWRAAKMGLRVGLAGLTCVIAALCENFANFSSVVGAFLVTSSGFVVPAVISFKLHPQARSARRAGEFALGAFGGMMCVTGTAIALRNIGLL